MLGNTYEIEDIKKSANDALKGRVRNKLYIIVWLLFLFYFQ